VLISKIQINRKGAHLNFDKGAIFHSYAAAVTNYIQNELRVFVISSFIIIRSAIVTVVTVFDV